MSKTRLWMRASVLVTTCFAAGSAAAQGKPEKPASPEKPQTPAKPTDKPEIKTETVKLKQGDATFDCYLARPASGEPAPGILVIHEWWGLNDWVKKQADRFAEKGYVALAVDLYRGEIAKDRDHAHELSRGLSDERALADLRFAFEFLSGHKYTRDKPTGVIGWCMGGGYALKLAIAEPRLACTVVCYGRPVTDVDQLKKIKGPLLGIWGETDRGIEVEPFKKALETAGAKATHHVYPGAGHAFLNENNERGYNKTQAEKAWAEIDEFFKRELAGTKK
jgi:carboxymethylenebutenolidase